LANAYPWLGESLSVAYSSSGALLSAGVRELLGDVETHMRRVAEQLDRSR
jgi:hypothetical protein